MSVILSEMSDPVESPREAEQAVAGLSRWQTVFDRWLTTLAAPVDAASLAVLRLGFGLIAVWWAIDYLRLGIVTEIYLRPQIHLGYYLFDFVKPWSGIGLYLHFLVLAISAAFIAAGFFYRVSTLVFATAFTIFFLWDRSNYQNHYYLLLLLSWMLVFLPLNRLFAIDALEQPAARSATMPAWALWLVRLQIGIPYFYGGLAKLNSDWLAGAAMRDFMAMNRWPPALAEWMTSREMALGLSWGGLAFDLLIVPLLLWRRTRVVAYFAAVVFHVTNHFLFSIHIFPWFMIVATTIFFEPGWPRRLLRLPQVVLPRTSPVAWARLSWWSRWGVVVGVCYVMLQLLLPLRHHVYGGDVGWHERGHYFAWRMMLRSKRTAVRIFFTDPALGETWYPNLGGLITGEQLSRLTRDPEMLLDLAHQLADRYRRETGRTLEVRAMVLACYNGRKPQLLIDPAIDLAKEPRGFYARTWIMPQKEPLLAEPWNRPVSEWEAAVVIPPLPVVTRGPKGEQIRPPQVPRLGTS